MAGYLPLVFLYFPAALVLLTMVLYALSVRIPFFRFYARLLAAYLSLCVCATYGVFASIALRLAGYGGRSQWATARSFKWVMRFTTGVRFVVEGEDHLKVRPAVFIGNHQTELDILMLGTVFPPYCSVTAKKSLRLMPFLGWFMALSGTVFIDRSNRSTAMAAFDGAAAHMQKDKQSVYIFPEGTRSYTSKPEMLPFKKGAFHLAVNAQVPIVPIVVANYSNVLHVQSRIFEAGSIPVKVLPPISTAGLTAADVDDLAHSTRELMMRELISLSKRAQAQGVSMSASEAQRVDSAVAAKSTGNDVKA
ncbi:MAG: 1-acylglycerol-3-phosphate O-acyltransferase [Vezdaea acicularis]|nr:MAG: 1-acylglycerol-3-phosphate O-acyltransferase [Vezdaea acicularis]